MRTLTISRPVTVTLDSGGNGTLQLGPAVPGETWYPGSVTISSGGSPPTVAPLASCLLYAGAAATPPNLVDSTYNVFGAASSIIGGRVIHPGQYVFAVFAGAVAHASATLVVSGTRTVP